VQVRGDTAGKSIYEPTWYYLMKDPNIYQTRESFTRNRDAWYVFCHSELHFYPI